MSPLKSCMGFVSDVIKKSIKDKLTLFCAYVSYYTVISMVPFLIIILIAFSELAQATDGDIVTFLGDNIPENIYELVIFILKDTAEKKCLNRISYPLIALLWASSRAVKAVGLGLDLIFSTHNHFGFLKRNLIVFYQTLLLIFVALLHLVVLSVIDFLPYRILKNAKSMISFLILTSLTAGAYALLPSERGRYVKMLYGAVFSSVGWILFSRLFSIYVKHFSNASYIYGGLFSLVLILIWIYASILIFFIGGEINSVIEYGKKNVDTN